MLRAADIFLEHGIVMESGPHKHAIQQTFFLYTWEPGGNRIEICAGGFLIFAPDARGGRLDAGRALERSGLGHADRPVVPHQGLAAGARGGRAPCPPDTEPSSSRARELVRGAYDLHVHVEPDLAKRRIDDLSWRAASPSSGWPASCSSRTTSPTAERAAVVRAAVPGVDALGAITLNAGVGGLNAQAVEIAAREGARIVWLPTVDSENEASEDGPKPAKQPVWRKISDEFVAAGVGDRAGEADDDALGAGLEVVARHDLVLATGHLGRAEIHTPSTRRSRRASRTSSSPTPTIRRRACRSTSSASWPSAARCSSGASRRSTRGKVSWEQTFEAIRATGADDNVLSTDLGQLANPPVEDGLALMADRLLEPGFTEDDVRTMAVVNTRRLADA